jgi:hypothetical protein
MYDPQRHQIGVKLLIPVLDSPPAAAV